MQAPHTSHLRYHPQSKPVGSARPAPKGSKYQQQQGRPGGADAAYEFTQKSKNPPSLELRQTAIKQHFPQVGVWVGVCLRAAVPWRRLRW